MVEPGPQSPAVRAPGAGWVLRFFPSVRDTERERFVFFFALSALLCLAQTLGLAGSEALFLERIGPEALPHVFVAAPVITVAGCLLYAAVVGVQRNDDLFSAMLVLCGVTLAILGGAALAGVPYVFHTLFCAAYLTQAVLINLHFWTFAADFFDTLQSKRLYPYLVVGASGGGVVGGLIAALAGFALPAEALIGLWAVALLCGAGLLVRARSDLRRWRTVGGEERDESSTSGLQGAVRFLTRSRLALWLVISIVGMISSLFVLQYLYLGIFSESFATAETLAIFLGVYLAVSNGIEILTATVLTPHLLHRFGVPTANLVHPVLTVAVFPLVAANPSLLPAVLARAVRELLENAMAAPIRQLAYNALPFRFRGRVRALLEGVVLFAAMALAGGLLLAIAETASLTLLCGIGAAMGAAYFGASIAVRRAYLSSLVDELRRGRLDLSQLDAELGVAGMTNLAAQWQRILEDSDAAPGGSVLRFARDLAEHGFSDIVVHASHHREPAVRRACVEALLDFDPAALEPHLERLLGDADERVRLATLRALVEFPSRSDRIGELLEAGLHDPAPGVRAAAAFVAGPLGVDILRALLDSGDRAATVAALEHLPAELTPLALPALDHEAADVRAAAIRCLAREAFEAPLPTARLLETLDDPDAGVRAAAAAALVFCRDEDAEAVIAALASALDDAGRTVRLAAAEALAQRGEAGVEAALGMVRHPRLWTAHAALHATASAKDHDITPSLLVAYRACVRDAWRYACAVELAPEEPNFPSRFTRVALSNAYERTTRLAFEMLAVLEAARVVHSVRRTLERGSNRGRADALEVLSHLADREASGWFALLLEAGPFAEKRQALAGAIELPADFPSVLTTLESEDDRWLRLAARAARGDEPNDSTTPSPAKTEVDLMQRLLALRKVPLFSELSLDRLEAIHQLMSETQFLRGEVVVREGDPADDLYVLIEGELEIYKDHGTKDERLLNTQNPIAYMGEIAILDGSPRSATAIASKDSRLLRLGGEPFKEIVLQTPEISFEIFKVLTARIRAAETRRA